MKAYFQKNKIRYKARRDARRLADPSAEYRSLRLRRPWKAAYNAKRGNAKKAGVEWRLTEQWYEKRYKRGCEITGIPFSMGDGVISPRSATVDRLNAAKAYTPSNCRMVLHAVNALRGAGSDEEMLEVALAVVRFFRRRR